MRFVTHIVLTLFMALVLTSSADAQDKDAASYQKAIEQWGAQLAELSKLDAAGGASEKIEAIRSLLGQGQAYLATEKLEQVDGLLQRADALALFVRAHTARVAKEKVAEDAQKQAAAAEQAAQEAKARLEATVARRDELEAQGL